MHMYCNVPLQVCVRMYVSIRVPAAAGTFVHVRIYVCMIVPALLLRVCMCVSKHNVVRGHLRCWYVCVCTYLCVYVGICIAGTCVYARIYVCM